MHLIAWLLACTQKALVPIAAEPAVFGWRLVPGQEISYSITTIRSQDSEQVERLEHWSYLVRNIDNTGTAHLEGRLVGLGMRHLLNGKTSPEESIAQARRAESDRLGSRTVELEISSNGRLGPVEGLDWLDALPHRLLSLPLPERPVLPGAHWSDPALARPWANLVPAEQILDMSGTQTYVGLYQEGDEILALFQSSGRIASRTVGEVLLKGETWWDPDPGQLHRRTLHGGLIQGEDPIAGSIEIRLERI